MLNLKQVFETIGDYKNFCKSHDLEIKEIRLNDNYHGLKVRVEYTPDKGTGVLTFYLIQDDNALAADRSYEKLMSYLTNVSHNLLIENDQISIKIDRSYRYTHEKVLEDANSVQLAIRYKKDGRYAVIIID